MINKNDNIYIKRPEIVERIEYKYIIPENKHYISQDNRSEYKKKQDQYNAQHKYNKYIEDKQIKEGTEKLMGFINFLDYAGLATGATGLSTKIPSLLKNGIKYTSKHIRNNIASKEIEKQSKKLLDINKKIPNNVGWGPKQSIHVIHDTNSNKLPNLYFPERWDAVNEGAPKTGIWFQGKIGIPRTLANHSIKGKTEKAEKARNLFFKRPYRLEGDLELEKPIITVGEVSNRSELEHLADKMGADGVIFNNVYDNGYSNNQVIFSFKDNLKNRILKKK